MPFPSDPSQDNVIPLSQAQGYRKGDEPLEISESRIEEIFNKVLSQQVAKNFEDLQHRNENILDKIERLQNSMNRIVSQFTAIQNGETEDPALIITTNSDEADIATCAAQIKQEDYYTYTTGEIADALSITIDKVVKLGKKLGLRNNSEYHKAIKTGKVARVQKYSQPAFNKIRQEIERENGLS